ncbi:MAG: hypothetical protein A9Z00_00865 [Thermobacillus sp. ZCTH02-B1]|uniref:diphosphate--fructose-6-phosphate 1-phosphotransferase n=1 Tax=Thermobacillus sp. ZCTH02-B1 TaxID=1858795 RepID=UPI000B549BFF|nr:diphosphate--fructose-6-phosphate 1-phosphotransferase [Thermobacillus sp. ZCTH02-B1]OUM94203.1 MAG: hypothetical protein A9Z00_00865 [Thermobacillus sp. ZCTH02-B1]
MNAHNKPKVAIGQAGGPTSVVNASLVGFLEEARDHFRVFGIVNALQGLVEDWLVEVDDQVYGKIREYFRIPGSVLGSGRRHMAPGDFAAAVDHLRKRDIHHLVLIGGNGTMYACRQMELAAQAAGYDLTVIGIPKTVDNDLLETDHTPGYGSAARYVAASVRDIGEDLKAMQNFETVRIIETMGRNVGWLAASSLLLKEAEHHPPHFVYVPERPLVLDRFLGDVERAVSRFGYAMVVISEGVRDLSGQVLSRIALNRDANSTVLGGASKYLANQVARHLNLPVRAELLGMNQRCFAAMASAADRMEAELLGREAVRLLRRGESGVMLTLVRDEASGAAGLPFRVGSCPLERVAGKERPLPDDVLNEDGTQASAAFKAWLRQLAGDDLKAYPGWSFMPGRVGGRGGVRRI